MNRRKPRLDVAVVPVEAGEEEGRAVLRKACRTALAALAEQGDGREGPARLTFLAGYLAGHARHQALKHGIDAEAACGEDAPMQTLLRELGELSPQHVRAALSALRFLPRSGASSARTALRAGTVEADAGYLVGHLESLCGTRRLLRSLDDTASFLTACDIAADRMQTHHPTAALRFDSLERGIVARAIAGLD